MVTCKKKPSKLLVQGGTGRQRSWWKRWPWKKEASAGHGAPPWQGHANATRATLKRCSSAADFAAKEILVVLKV